MKMTMTDHLRLSGYRGYRGLVWRNGGSDRFKATQRTRASLMTTPADIADDTADHSAQLVVPGLFSVVETGGPLSDGCTLYGRGRDIEEFETAVQFDKATCRWAALGKANEVRRTDERGSILAALAEAREPMSPTQIADATGMPNQNVRQTLSRMAKAGEVVKAKPGQYVHSNLSQSAPCHNTLSQTRLILSKTPIRMARDPGECDHVTDVTALPI